MENEAETAEAKPEDAAEEKPEQKPEEPPPSTERSLAKIASAIGEVRAAIAALALVFILNQCSSGFKPESDEVKALKSIDYSLRMLHDDLRRDRDEPSVGMELRGIDKRLSEINGTIWDKSCSR
ncbi:MAG TPA: hypothetical protein VL283_03310 [Candidatus Baltobacteraceae bacterium]|nr:hypothetical protein [Candidatus Baltobacteraceae bacterium]